MATPVFITKNTRGNNTEVAGAYQAAQEAYGDAQRAIYQEGDAAQCETAEELNDLLRDHAQRVASVFERVLRDADDKTSPEWKAAFFTDLGTFENRVKEALEDEVDETIKADLNF